MKRKLLFLFTLFLLLASCRQESPVIPIAFPGAEGYGKYTVGGRGGRVIKVTNLNDSGPGSLRDAVEQTGPRIVVFEVDGTIELQSTLRIDNDSITVAGQTAPGEGICLKDYPLVVNASEVIVRYLRSRLGDRYQLDSDAIGGGRYEQKNVILDHLSASWSIDECLSIYKTENLTVQWCLVSHSLNQSLHTKGSHGFGGIWGGYKATFHHNLLAHHASRNPRFSSVEQTKMVDYRNNVVYNWDFKTAYGGGRYGEINMVNNYYKPGPASKHTRLLDVAEDGTGKYYLSGNVMEGDEEACRDNWSAVGGKNPLAGRVEEPFAYEPIPEELAQEAYESVLAGVGCSLRQDSYDAKVIEEVRRGTAGAGDRGIINTPSDVGGWPLLRSGTPLPDSDGDGIPDAWELANGLDPNDPSDASVCSLHPFYTNIEMYIHSLVADK